MSTCHTLPFEAVANESLSPRELLIAGSLTGLELAEVQSTTPSSLVFVNVAVLLLC